MTFIRKWISFTIQVKEDIEKSVAKQKKQVDKH